MTTQADPPDRRSDPPHNHDHHTPTADNGGRLLQQTLMSHPECYVYRVPPCSTTSQGYRAQEWNLGQPLQECGFQVERRNNDLYLLFTLEHHTKLFALTKIEGTTETGGSSSGGGGSATNTTTTNTSIDTVLDSSRYFVTKILQSTTTNETSSSTTTPTRTALLGFGFRDRDIALDLLGNVQQFQRSIQRELDAKVLKEKFTAIPQLGTHDKIHISSMPGCPSRSGSRRAKTTTKKYTTTGTTPRTAGYGGGVLVKKPPPGAGVATTTPDLGPMPPSNNEGHRTKIDNDHTNPNAAGTGAAGTVATATDDDEEEEDFGDFQDGKAIITMTAAAAATTTTTAVLDEDARLDQEIEEVFEEFQL